MTTSLDAAGYPPFADDPTCACKRADWRLFFPEKSGRGGIKEDMAKAYCKVCPVLDECRAWSLPIRNLHGVWGGLNTTQRENIRRKALEEEE